MTLIVIISWSFLYPTYFVNANVGAQLELEPEPVSADGDIANGTGPLREEPSEEPLEEPPGPPEEPSPGARVTGEQTPPPAGPEPDRGEETEPDQEPTVPEEESNPSDVQSEDSQTIDESTSGATQIGVIIHRNTTDGFQIQVPAGWVVEDIDNTNISTQMNEQQSGYTYLARICPLDNALIVSVGRYQCEQASTANVNIMRFNNLHQRPEFASLGNRDMTTSDFLSYYIQFWQRTAGISDVQIQNNIDTTTNVINSQTNQIVATMPAKLVEYTYLYSPDGTTMTQGREFTLLVLNGGIGYSLFYEGLASSLTSGTPPVQVDQMFDSFRLLS